jgi:hypothetical protein
MNYGGADTILGQQMEDNKAMVLQAKDWPSSMNPNALRLPQQ